MKYKTFEVTLFAFVFISALMVVDVSSAPAGTNEIDLNCRSETDFFYVSPNPFVQSTEYWTCRLNTTNAYRCWSHVWVDDKSQKLQTNPERIKIEEVGIIDYFASSNGLVNVFFTTKNLKLDQNYTFEVECIDTSENWGNFERNVTVELSGTEVYNVAPAMVWVTDNAIWIIGIFLVALIVISGGAYLIKQGK